MNRKLHIVVKPFQVHGESGWLRTVKENEHLFAEIPLGKDKVVVELDNRQVWAYRSEFVASTKPT